MDNLLEDAEKFEAHMARLGRHVGGHIKVRPGTASASGSFDRYASNKEDAPVQFNNFL